MNDFFSFSFFLLSSFLFVRREENRRRHNKHHKGENENDSNYDDDNDSTLKTTETTISSRGKKAILPGPRYMKAFMKCFSDPCDPSSHSSSSFSSLRNPNPNGYIGLCVAENKLGECQEMLAQRLMRPGTAITCFSDSIVYEVSFVL